MSEQTVYHGSDVTVDKPLVGVGRRDLDFGPGFYVTPLYEQAFSWASKVKLIRLSEHIVVNEYSLTYPAQCNVKKFDSYNEEWLNFIVDSRKGRTPWKDYDIVEGGIANDRVINAVEAYINGFADVKSTLDKLVYQKPNYQICILKQEIIDEYLHYKSSKIF